MKKNLFKTVLLAGSLSVLFSFASLAGEWKQDTTGWWWQNDDGSYPTSQWQWVDGNNDGISECYYFDPNGYMMVNTEVEGSTVNGDGAWAVNGIVQTQGTAQQTANNNTDIKLETNFIKQEYIDCLGKDKDYVLNRLGSEFKESEFKSPFYDSVDSLVDDTHISLHFDPSTGTVFEITSMMGWGMFNTSKTGYTYGDLNELLKTDAFENQKGTISWRLSENPIVILENTPDNTIMAPRFTLYYSK